MNRPPPDDPIELARWRCRNICILNFIRGVIVGVIAVATVWFLYRLFRP